MRKRGHVWNKHRNTQTYNKEDTYETNTETQKQLIIIVIIIFKMLAERECEIYENSQLSIKSIEK